MIAREGSMKVRIEENGREEDIPRMRFLVRTMMSKAEAGDFRALRFILERGLEEGSGIKPRKKEGQVAGSRTGGSRRDRERDRERDRQEAEAAKARNAKARTDELSKLRHLEKVIVEAVARRRQTDPERFAEWIEEYEIKLDHVRTSIRLLEFEEKRAKAKEASDHPSI